jgi:hypothetical protein
MDDSEFVVSSASLVVIVSFGVALANSAGVLLPVWLVVVLVGVYCFASVDLGISLLAFLRARWT